METAAPDDERRNRLLPADRTQDGAHASLSSGAGKVSKSRGSSDKEPPHYARHRCATGTGRPQLRRREPLHHIARSRIAKDSRAANLTAFRTARSGATTP